MIAAVIGTTRLGHRRRGDLDALDRRKNRDGRRDHAVAEEQRSAEDPQRRQHNLRPAPAGNSSPADQGDQRHDPALAVVVGAHHQQDVSDGDDDRHRPEDQRDDPENVLRGHLDRVRIARIEDRLDGVQRAGADVPEDNPKSTNRKSPLGGSAPVHGYGIRLPAHHSPAHHPSERRRRAAVSPRRRSYGRNHRAQGIRQRWSNVVAMAPPPASSTSSSSPQPERCEEPSTRANGGAPRARLAAGPGRMGV